jgi:hypothetical protein
VTDPRTEGLRDAAAWLQATANGDTAGREAIALHCDPTELVDAITETLLWLLKDQGIPLGDLLDTMRRTADRDDGTSQD